MNRSREDSGQQEPVTPGELLRHALVDDQDPRFPRWLPLPGILLAVAWAAFQAAMAAPDVGATLATQLGVLLGAFLWPGAAIFAVTTLAAWFGWQLEID